MDTDFIRERITRLRLKKGVSEYRMSYDLGHSRSYIYNISSGKSLPPMEGFLQICEYLGVSPATFFDAELDDPALHREAEELLKRLGGEDLKLVLELMRRLEK